MDSINILSCVRKLIADDSTMRSLIGETTSTGMLNTRLPYRDAIYSSANSSGSSQLKYPHLNFKIDEDDPQLRGSDDNTVMLIIEIVNSYRINYAATNNLRIKDQLKYLLRDKHEDINDKGSTLSPPVTIHIRDIAWVSAITYDDKEQGSEQSHKIMCNLKLVIGD